MKKRIITAIAAIIIILVPCFFLLHTLYLAVLISIFSAIGVYEIIHATGGKNNFTAALSCISAAVIPFLIHFKVSIPFAPVAAGFVLLYLLIMVLMHKKTSFSDILTALFSMTAIPLGLSVFIILRDCYITYPNLYGKEYGIFYILLAMFSAWGTDTFALFCGKLFGKRKLCPNISPNKTVEGAIGGVICAAVMNTVLFLIFDNFFFTMHTISIFELIIISAVLSVAGIFGDLAASVIKRNHSVKDFGNIFPGHGGVMDRIDSCLAVLGALYLTVSIIGIRG